MPANDVQVRKYRKRFRLLDVNGNGRLDLSDYQAIAHRFHRLFDLAPGSDKAILLEETYTRLFHVMHRHGDHNADGVVDEREFIDTTASSLHARPDGFERSILPVLRAIAQVSDKNDNAAWDRAKMACLLRAEGVQEPDRTIALRHLFPTGTRHLDFAALVRAVREFYCSPSPTAPGSWLLGTF